MPNVVVPLCLYQNNYTHDSYVSYPLKSRENGKDVYKCKDLNADLLVKFYAIDPDLPVIPQNMSIVSILETEQGEFTTINVSLVYDPYPLKDNEFRFMAWIDRTPYSSPLHIYKNGSHVYMSFGPKPEGYDEEIFSPIYVLLDPRIEVERVPYKHDGDFKVENNIPQFLFSNDNGKCIPNPQGIEFDQCVTKYSKNLLLEHRHQTLVQYIGQQYGDKKESDLTIVVVAIILLAIVVAILIS
jgi:hypothetical protein